MRRHRNWDDSNQHALIRTQLERRVYNNFKKCIKYKLLVCFGFCKQQFSIKLKFKNSLIYIYICVSSILPSPLHIHVWTGKQVGFNSNCYATTTRIVSLCVNLVLICQYLKKRLDKSGVGKSCLTRVWVCQVHFCCLPGWIWPTEGSKLKNKMAAIILAFNVNFLSF